MNFLQTARKLVLGETWRLPLGIAGTLVVAAGIRLWAGPDGWWEHAGGAILALLLTFALASALPVKKS